MSSVYVIIATAYQRTTLLLNRALTSVYTQKDIDNAHVKVIIVDDNDRSGNSKSTEYEKIVAGVQQLREILQLNACDYETTVLSNERIQHHSGTGAWNTGIQYANSIGADAFSFISILDDDDAFLPLYLHSCLSTVSTNTSAVFAELSWVSEKKHEIYPLTREQITQEEFFIGNPGIQGSNLFIRNDVMTAIGGFDEQLPSATDRDIMIRILDYLGEFHEDQNPLTFEIINEPLVNHYNHNGLKVTDDLEAKAVALNLFYKKYRDRFSNNSFDKSLARAKRHFNYQFSGAKHKIVIVMALKNSMETIHASILSVLNQKNVLGELQILLVNDNSTDSWRSVISDLLIDPRILLIDVDLGSSHAVRNFSLDYIRENIQDVTYIGRLDADDIMAHDNVISNIENILEYEKPDVILMGNQLKLDGRILDRVNFAEKRLLDPGYLHNRLIGMAKGAVEAELPSCNTLVKPYLTLDYPEVSSAEDHWYTVELLLRPNINIHIAEDILYAVYSLDGAATKQNRVSGDYHSSRQKLLEHYEAKLGC